MKTINAEFSDNTLYTLAFILWSLHLLMYDYGFVFDARDYKLQVNTSIYCSYFGCMMIASRLHNELQVFTISVTNILCYMFLPFLRKALMSYSKKIYYYSTFIFEIVIAFGIFEFSRLLGNVYVVGMLLINFACPVWLIWLYQYKNVIEGPWDLPNVKSYSEQAQQDRAGCGFS
eukprot:TRINITY_DN11547_c0_g1_i2.p2 TRINITY_DN11547_c0_g1~~TRINITY_DN11547_c0_g1_i2.p2  ORF type:complete len:174 (+),score=15.24 TRINITY_DN11547_c0_g1_i2:638-1159(+)